MLKILMDEMTELHKKLQMGWRVQNDNNDEIFSIKMPNYVDKLLVRRPLKGDLKGEYYCQLHFRSNGYWCPEERREDIVDYESKEKLLWTPLVNISNKSANHRPRDKIKWSIIDELLNDIEEISKNSYLRWRDWNTEKPNPKEWEHILVYSPGFIYSHKVCYYNHTYKNYILINSNGYIFDTIDVKWIPLQAPKN